MSNKGKEKTGTQVAEVKQQAGEQVPAHLQNTRGQGTKLKAEADDFVVPRVKLLHGTSKEPDAFNEAKVGEYWANVLDIGLGKSFDFIVCANRKQVLLIRPIDDKSGESILARASDAKTWDRTGEWPVLLKNIKKPIQWKIEDLDVRKSGLLEFGTSNPEDEDSNPAATVFHDYLVFLPAHPELGPALFSLARTAAKRAKMLNSKIEMRCEGSNVDMQALKFTAIVTSEPGPSGDYYNMDFRANGFATDAEFKRCLSIADRFKDYSAAGEDEVAGETGGSKTGNVKRDENTEV